jgi:DNA-binding NtrC family response regulator
MARVLLVDDDEQFRRMLERTLVRAGHRVRVAGDGAEALGVMREDGGTTAFDLVVTDIVMPEKEGLETIMELRRLVPGMPVIAMSGGGRGTPENYLRAARMLGAFRTLEKPFDSKELIQAIDEAGRSRRAGAS